MAAKKPTKDVELHDKAAKAAEMKAQGWAYEDILKETGYSTTLEMMQAVRAYNESRIFSDNADRAHAMQTELDAINGVISRMYTIMENPPGKYNKDGDWLEPDVDAIIKAGKVILDGVKARSHLQGLDRENVRDVTTQVLVVGGDQTTYREALATLADQD